MAKMFKLVTGDYVIASELIEDAERDVYIAKEPYSLMFDPIQGGVGALPYDIQYTNKIQNEVEFKKEHVMHILDEVDQELLKGIEETKKKFKELETGIVQPANNKIIT
jgi:acetylornithine/succinyldiaminopimelate/putrescine aminotransferase